MSRSTIIKFILAITVALSVALAQTANTKQPQVKSQKEGEAIMAMFNAPDPDARIAAANNLVTKFADTDFKATAFYMAAFSYQQKNDTDNVIVYAEKTLETDPKFYDAMLMIANILAMRTREFDLDKEEKLGRAEKLAKQAMDLIATAPKVNANVTDDQWAAAKKDFNSRAHEALGLSATVRKKYDVCVSELKQAVEGAAQADPSTMVRLANCQLQTKEYDAALAVLDKALADPSAVPQVKQAATNLKIDINKAKAAQK